MDREISLKQILSIVLQRWWIIAVSVILCGTVAFTWNNFFVTPKYQAITTLYVNNDNNRGNSSTDLNINDLTVSQKLVETYIVILKSDRVLGLVADETNLGYTVGQIRSMLQMSAVSQTEVLQIAVTGENPQHCALIANKLAQVAPDEIIRVVKAGSVEVVDKATANYAKISPNVALNTILGIGIGLILAILILFLLELFDTRVKDEDSLMERFRLPILGSIPDLYENPQKAGEGYKS